MKRSSYPTLFALASALTSLGFGQSAQELHLRANAKQDRGDYRGALEDYDKALALAPKSASTYTCRGNAKHALGDLDGAIADHDRAIQLMPKLAIAYSNRGYAKQSKDDLAGAISDYEHALKLDPKLALAANNRTVAFRKVLSTLQSAVRTDDLAKLKATVDAIPAAARTADRLGWTPLHYVAMQTGRANTVAMAELLLKLGANPSARDEEGNTPLHYAGGRNSTPKDFNEDAYDGLIALLLAHKASVTERNGLGLMPLHTYTIRNATPKAVEQLLDHQAPISAKATRDGWTPLHGAAGAGRTDLVEILLRRGADKDKDARDNAGRTPREVALQMQKNEIAELLK